VLCCALVFTLVLIAVLCECLFLSGRKSESGVCIRSNCMLKRRIVVSESCEIVVDSCHRFSQITCLHITPSIPPKSKFSSSSAIISELNVSRDPAQHSSHADRPVYGYKSASTLKQNIKMEEADTMSRSRTLPISFGSFLVVSE